MPGSCKSCGAELLWAKTPKGRAIPLDPEPREDGNVVLEDGVAFVFGKTSGIAPRLANRPRYVSHFATCEQADEHRRRRAKMV